MSYKGKPKVIATVTANYMSNDTIEIEIENPEKLGVGKLQNLQRFALRKWQDWQRVAVQKARGAERKEKEAQELKTETEAA